MMSENTKKFNDNLAEDDEEFVMCQICCLNFDEKEHVPKYLKCHHFFCLSCIKLLTGPKQNVVSCPTCRSQSVLSPKKCEELYTNRLALRLLKVVEGVQEKAEKEAKQGQQWCLVCAFPACMDCHETKHEIQDYTQFYNARTLLLDSISNKTNSLCNETLEDCHKIESAHQVMLAWIKWLQMEIVQSAASNTATIAQLESFITDEAWAHVPQEENMYATINNINQLIAKCSNRCEIVEKAEVKTRAFLRAFRSAHEESAQFFEPEQFSGDGSPPDLVSWLKRLSTSDVGITFSQSNRRCVNVLAFLISLLSGEQLHVHGLPSNGVAVNVDANARNDFVADITGEPRPSCSGTRRLAKRHALDESGPNTPAYKRERVLPRDENACVINNSTNSDGYVYHSLNGEDAVQQIEETSQIMGTYNTSAHENVFLPYGTGRIGSATMRNIPHLSEMDVQHMSQTPMPSRKQIGGPSKAENPFLQGFRTDMRVHKSPDTSIVNWQSSTSPLNLSLNNVVPTPAISNGGMWTGVDHRGAAQTRIEDAQNWRLNIPRR